MARHGLAVFLTVAAPFRGYAGRKVFWVERGSLLNTVAGALKSWGSAAAVVVAASFIVAGLLSCKQRDEGTEASPQAVGSGAKPYDVVFAQCFAPQGNGGNWAATLGWLSETIHLRLLEADIMAKQGKKVGLHFGCMVGGSSGSVATSVLSAILSNGHLLPGKGSQSVVSIDEARTILRAVRLVAQSADYNLTELVRFFGQVAWNESRATLRGTIGRVFTGSKPGWWDSQSGTVNPKHLLTDFATSLHFAATMTPEVLNRTISSALKGDQLQAYTKRGVSRAAELPEFADLDKVPRRSSPDGAVLAAAFARQSDFLQQLADNLVSKQFLPLEYKSRHLRDLSRNGPPYRLKETLDRPLGEGLCTITMAALRKSPKDGATQPKYEHLAPVVFCGEATARMLLESPVYRELVTKGHPYAARFVIAVVPTLRAGIVPSIREPNLMPPLSSPLGSGDLEVTRFYSPAWDKEAHGSLTFKLLDANKVTIGSQVITPHLAVAGGFPDRRISAWMASVFFLSNTAKRLAPLAREVRSNFALFGRDNSRATPAFHKNAVRNVFSSAASGEQNLKDWLTFADSWCDTMGSRLLQESKARVENVILDWEVSRLPAAQKPGGASNLLVVKAINATRTQAGRHLAGLRVVFDPEVDSRHVPRPAPTTPCKEM